MIAVAPKLTTRRRLAELLRSTGDTFTVEEAARALELPRPQAAKLLARWTKSGRLVRVKQGLYIAVPLESVSGEVVPEDPWVVASTAFAPCYIGGWSAAEHWGLTEQLFRTLIVFSGSPPRERKQTLARTEYWIVGTRAERMFGLKSVWRGRTRVQVSDPVRTVVDMLDNPEVGGGIRNADDVLRAWIASSEQQRGDVIAYAEKLGNGAVFKRLGFLVERSFPDRSDLLVASRRNLSTGLAKLDPSLKCDRIVSRWRLRVPANWVK